MLTGFNDSIYSETIARTIASGIRQTDYDIVEVNDSSTIESDGSTALIIAFGASKLTQNIRSDRPTLAIVPEIPVSKAKKSGNIVKNAVLYMAQPMCRQLQLISLIDPGWDSIGILAAETIPDSASFKPCIDNLNMTVNITVINKNKGILNPLNQTLINNDVLLALPDSAIYNSRNIKNILLTAYRKRVPIIGFSEGFVSAGALAAVHTRPEDIGKQVADIVSEFIQQGHRFSNRAYYSKTFNVSINKQVARSLDLKIPPDDVIESELKKMSVE